MFTIDLLKGQGIPIKSRPESVAVVASAVAISIIVTIVMFSFYLNNNIAISLQKQEITNYETKLSRLSHVLELQKSFEDEKNTINSILSEVWSSLDRHTHWSPVIAALVKNMPNQMLLTMLEGKQKYIKTKVPGKNNPKEDVEITVPVRSLHIGVSASPQYDCDKMIRSYTDRLRASTLLGPRLESISVSQKADTLEGLDIVSYQIDCIFKLGS